MASDGYQQYITVPYLIKLRSGKLTTDVAHMHDLYAVYVDDADVVKAPGGALYVIVESADRCNVKAPVPDSFRSSYTGSVIVVVMSVRTDDFVCCQAMISQTGNRTFLVRIYR